MLGDLRSCGCGHECRGSGDVERVRAISAGAAGIYEQALLHCTERHWNSRSPHRIHKSSKLFRSLSARRQGAKDGRDLHIGRLTKQHQVQQGRLPLCG